MFLINVAVRLAPWKILCPINVVIYVIYVLPEGRCLLLLNILSIMILVGIMIIKNGGKLKINVSNP